jgi:hypothetical protein
VALVQVTGVPPTELEAQQAAYMKSEMMKYHPNADQKGLDGKPRFGAMAGNPGGGSDGGGGGFGPDRATESPSSSGRANARGMAAIMGALVRCHISI